MDKKYIIRIILLNTAWVMWIALSIFLGYIIYYNAFPSQPIVIIPFSLLFLIAGGAVTYTVYRFLKKRRPAGSAAVTRQKEEGRRTERDEADEENADNRKSRKDGIDGQDEKTANK